MLTCVLTFKLSDVPVGIDFVVGEEVVLVIGKALGKDHKTQRKNERSEKRTGVRARTEIEGVRHQG